MRALQEAGDTRPQLELSFGHYDISGASIGWSRDGTEFAFTVGPLSDATVAALDGAARKHGSVCLLLPQPLLLDLVTLERKEHHRARIVGRIASGTSAATWSGVPRKTGVHEQNGGSSASSPDAADSEHEPRENHILDALPADERDRLFAHMTLVDMPLGTVLHEAGDELRHVYFPIDSIVSLLYVLKSGASAEIAVVGNEGAIGLALLMGGETTQNRAVVQSGGSAYRLAGQRLKDEFARHGTLEQVVLRSTQSLITQMAQTAVCNRHHSLDQQFCRWLLLSLDRLSSNQLNMTQELIAAMLGVRRERVTTTTGKLVALGVIEYGGGRITVLDRPKLENLSCECYVVVKKETDRLRSPHAYG